MQPITPSPTPSAAPSAAPSPAPATRNMRRLGLPRLLAPTCAAWLSVVSLPAYAADPCKDLAQLDDTIHALAKAPPTVGTLGQLRAYSAAVARLAERTDKAAACAGSKPSTVITEHLGRSIDAAKNALRLELHIDGEADSVATALDEGLASLGYTNVSSAPAAPAPPPTAVKKKSAAAPTFDVAVDVVIRMEPETGPPQKLVYVKATVRVTLSDANGKPLGGVETAYRYGGVDEMAAHDKAVAGLAERAKTSTAQTIDKLLRAAS